MNHDDRGHEITHERCSELLREYLEGALEERAAASVAAHLESCDDCAAELAGLTALVAPVAELTPGERDELRRAVRAGARPEPAPGRVIELPDRSTSTARGGRIAGALGAVAAVAALALGVAYLSGGAGTLRGDDEAGGAGMEAAAPEVGPRPVFDASGEEASVAALEAQEDGAGDAGVEEENQAETFGTTEDSDGGERAVARRDFLPGGRITRAHLLELGARGEPFTGFAGAYSAPVEASVQQSFLDDLATAAPPDLRGQVRECGEEVMAGNNRVLPAYGADRRFRDEDVLVLGFVTSSTTEAPLDGFLFFLWPRASCDFPVTSVGGQIAR